MTQQQAVDTVWKYLKNNRLISIATISVDKNSPEASLVYYYFEKPPFIYCSTYKTSRKFKNIESNNKVALVIGQEAESVVLQIEGSARIIQDTDLKTEVLEKLAKVANQNTQSSFFPPLLSLSADNQMEFIEITIDWFKYSVFESHFPTIIEGKSNDWREYTLK